MSNMRAWWEPNHQTFKPVNINYNFFNVRNYMIYRSILLLVANIINIILNFLDWICYLKNVIYFYNKLTFISDEFPKINCRCLESMNELFTVYVMIIWKVRRYIIKHMHVTICWYYEIFLFKQEIIEVLSNYL